MHLFRPLGVALCLLLASALQADELLTAMMLSFIESGDRQGATNR